MTASEKVWVRKQGGNPKARRKELQKKRKSFQGTSLVQSLYPLCSCESLARVHCVLIFTRDVVFFCSDDDDFYDRTKKKPSTQKGSESQTVETVDSLLEKRDKVLKDIEEKNDQLSAEKNKMETETVTEVESGDSLDAYMTGLSTTLGNFYNFVLLCFQLIKFTSRNVLRRFFSFYWCQCKIKLPRSSKSYLLFSQNWIGYCTF